MLYEFIRYHTELGMKVIVFDRNAANWQHIQSSNLYTRRGKNIEEYDFDYYNYTILDLLRPYPADTRAESLEGLSNTIVLTDFDKRFTLTYCRYVAKALYGIDRVLVLDFDEFFFCPSAPKTAAGQQAFWQQHLDKLKSKGVDQYVMRQRILVSRTPDMAQCFVDQIKKAKKAIVALESANHHAEEQSLLLSHVDESSIFHCLTAYRFLIRRNFDKSFHLGHFCPYTSFHSSSHLRYFDCDAATYRDFDDGCTAIHYTTKPPNYNRSHDYSMEKIRMVPSELQVLTNLLPSPLRSTSSTSSTEVVHRGSRIAKERIDNISNSSGEAPRRRNLPLQSDRQEEKMSHHISFR